MTLFDVIRFTISTPPRPGELEALPKALYEDWYNNHTFDWHIHKDHDGTIELPAAVQLWMEYVCDSGVDHHARYIEEVKGDLNALRMLILKHND